MWTNIQTSTRNPKKSQKWTFHDIYPTHWPYIKYGFSLGKKVAGDNHQEVVYRQHKRVILTQKKCII